MLINFWLKCYYQWLPKHLLTLLAGLLAEVEWPWVKDFLITHFIRHYQVDMREAELASPKDYRHFNAFFIRALKAGSRPVAAADWVSPVDGFMSEFGRIEAGMLLQAKQQQYRLEDLLACSPEQARLFADGSFATCYLSPRDYHRVHMPIAATLHSMVYLPGQLFSVQPATTRVIPRLFVRNERAVVFFDTAFGPLAMVLVGATVVGRIATVWHGELDRRAGKQVFSYTDRGKSYQQAEEMGYFKLGSTVIMLWAQEAPLQWAQGIQVGAVLRQGQAFAQFTGPR